MDVINCSAISLYASIFILIYVLYSMYINNKNDKIHNPEYVKSIYGVYITIIEEYKDYFMKYELSRYTFIKNNEILADEYKGLVRSYVKLFFDRYGESETIKEIIKIKFSNKEAFISYLIHDFDIMLFNNNILSKDHMNKIYSSRT